MLASPSSVFRTILVAPWWAHIHQLGDVLRRRGAGLLLNELLVLSLRHAADPPRLPWRVRRPAPFCTPCSPHRCRPGSLHSRDSFRWSSTNPPIPSTSNSRLPRPARSSFLFTGTAALPHCCSLLSIPNCDRRRIRSFAHCSPFRPDSRRLASPHRSASPPPSRPLPLSGDSFSTPRSRLLVLLRTTPVASPSVCFHTPCLLREKRVKERIPGPRLLLLPSPDSEMLLTPLPVRYLLGWPVTGVCAPYWSVIPASLLLCLLHSFLPTPSRSPLVPLSPVQASVAPSRWAAHRLRQGRCANRARRSVCGPPNPCRSVHARRYLSSSGGSPTVAAPRLPLFCLRLALHLPSRPSFAYHCYI